MAVNQAVIGALEAQPVPLDRECVRNGTDIVKLVQDYVQVVGLLSQVVNAAGVTGGSSTPVTNNTGAQALALAQQIQSDLSALKAKIPQRRVVAIRQNVNTGDSIQPYSISPEMPDGDYEVRVTMIGGTTFPTNYYGWVVVNGSQTSNSFSIRYDNAKAGTTVNIVVEQLLSNA